MWTGPGIGGGGTCSVAWSPRARMLAHNGAGRSTFSMIGAINSLSLILRFPLLGVRFGEVSASPSVESAGCSGSGAPHIEPFILHVALHLPGPNLFHHRHPPMGRFARPRPRLVFFAHVLLLPSCQQALGRYYTQRLLRKVATEGGTTRGCSKVVFFVFLRFSFFHLRVVFLS